MSTPGPMSDEQALLLISLIAQGDAGPSHWESFRALAATDQKWWRELAMAQRDQTDLAAAVAEAVAVSDAVGLPLAGDCEAAGPRAWWPFRAVHLHRALAGPVSWGGWAVAAAMVTIALVLRFGSEPAPEPAPALDPTPIASSMTPASPGTTLVSSPDEAWQQYLKLGRDSGTVIREMPTRVLLDTRPAPSGDGVEVLFLRQVLERATVPDLYRWAGQDDLGQPAMVRWAPDRERDM